ncbi:MAG: DUF134 domain-containing protein [Ethanoligenens sp.]
MPIKYKGDDLVPRPQKFRRICDMPKCRRFGPLGEDSDNPPAITITVDEFEAIRLIDLEGLDQEKCAEQMMVARTTAQAVYASARAKLAECLVNGMQLTIQGGHFVLCGGESSRCCHCRKGCPAKGKQD